MKKILVVQTLAVFIAFSVVGLHLAPAKAMAANICENSTSGPGFHVEGKTWGSVVTICANYVAELTDTKLSSSAIRKKKSETSKPEKSKPEKSKAVPKKTDPKIRIRMLHRTLAMRGKNSFQPTALTILSSASVTKPGQQVRLSVFHGRQFRMAYIMNRFVSLRFTPTQIVFHFDSKTLVTPGPSQHFESSVRFVSEGSHTVRAVVTYQAEFRVNGEKIWRNVVGSPTLAARPARVLVIAEAAPPTPTNPPSARKPAHLVADDCLLHFQNIGCLN